jgi:hypothetical protein
MLYIITSLTAVVASILIILWMNKREKKRLAGFGKYLLAKYRHSMHALTHINYHQEYQEYLKSKKQNKTK